MLETTSQMAITRRPVSNEDTPVIDLVSTLVTNFFYKIFTSIRNERTVLYIGLPVVMSDEILRSSK